jgi:hypothetical protein
MARPIPPAPPVMTTILPSRLYLFIADQPMLQAIFARESCRR